MTRMPRKRDLDQLQSEIQDLFADLWQVPRFSGLRRGFRPHVDCYRTDDPPTLTVLVELPGVEPAEVQLIAAPSVLVIAGERRRPKDCGQYQQIEIEYGPFQRRVALDEDVDPEDATATYERGLLTIRLPIVTRPAPRESVPIVVRTS